MKVITLPGSYHDPVILDTRPMWKRALGIGKHDDNRHLTEFIGRIMFTEAQLELTADEAAVIQNHRRIQVLVEGNVTFTLHLLAVSYVVGEGAFACDFIEGPILDLTTPLPDCKVSYKLS